MNDQVNLDSKTVADDEVLYMMQEKLSSEEYMISQIRHSVNNLKSYGVHPSFLHKLLKELTILEQLNFDNKEFIDDEIKKLPE